MFFGYKNRKPNIKYFQAENSYLATFNNDNQLIINDIDLGKSNGHFFFLFDKFYYSEQGKDNCTMILDLQTKQTICIEYILTKNCLENNTFLQAFDLQRVEKRYYSAKISVMQFNPAIKLYDLPDRYIYSKCLRKDNLLFVERYQIFISSLSLLTGEYEWEVDLGEYCEFLHDGEVKKGNISNIIGVYEGKLWIICAYRRFVGLCVKTGEILTNLWFGDLRPELVNLIFSNVQPFYDETSSEFVFFIYKYYFKININSGKLTHFQRIPFEKEENSIGVQTLHEGLYYFTSQGWQLNETHIYISVYNPVNNQIEWYYNLGSIYINQPPQVSEDKLYVLDTGGTLHIFERETI